jgi:hypothetical protein
MGPSAARVVSWVYTLILVALASEIVGWTSFLPDEFLPYLVLLMGVVIMGTNISGSRVSVNGQMGVHTFPSWVVFVRRWLFGFVLVLMGLASAIPSIQNTFIASSLITTDSRSGALILCGIALIYLLSNFTRPRMAQMSSI